MATDILQVPKTVITWKASGGDRVLTLTSLATVSGRKGAYYDFGTAFAARVMVTLLTKFATSPTALQLVQVYWAASADGTNFDAGQTSSDAAFTDTDLNNQLIPIGFLVADNSTAAQQQSWLFNLPGRYGFPVVYNATSQALSGTAGDHVLSFSPLADQAQ